MNLLAFDTSAKAASVAICSEEKILSSFSVNAGLTHSQTMMPMAEAALRCANISLDQIDGFAVSVGPGSFTGLRIGIAAVKGLAYASEKPCIPVSTLEGLAENLTGFQGISCPVMDARRNQVYNGLFALGEGVPQRLCEDRAISIEALATELREYHQPIWLVGDGADLCMEQLRGDFPNLLLAPPSRKWQDASSVAFCAHRLYQQGKAVSAEQLIPSYLRLSQAERLRKDGVSP